MALFKLGKGYRVVTTEQGAGVIDPQGEKISLTPLEVQVLARAAASGLQHDTERLPTVIRRLAALGVLEVAAAAAAQPEPAAPATLETELFADVDLPADSRASVEAAAEAPKVTPALSLADVPAPMRADLTIDAPQRGLVNITNPTTGKTFALYDFEASLARMLDGKRTVAQILEAGGRLGIPVDLASLNQFIRQLDRYGFLAPRAAKGQSGASSGPWPARPLWDESIRAMYQAGVRLSRQGRYSDAIPYFEALLEQTPGNAEAAEMLDEARARAQSAAASPIADAQAAVAAATAEAEPELSITLAVGAPRAAALRRGLIAGALAIAVIGVAVISYRLGRSEAPVTVSDAPQPTKVASADAASQLEGAPDASVVLAEPAATAEPSAALTDAATPLAAVSDAAVGVAAMEPVAEPDASVAEPAAVAPDDRPAVVAAVDRRGRATMGEVRAPRGGAVHREAAPEQRVKRSEGIGSLEGAKAQPLSAPIAGLVMWQVDDGARVSANQVLAKIAYHEAYVMAWAPPEVAPKKSWGCSVDVPAENLEAPCLITAIERKARGWYVTVTAEPTWVERAPGLRLRLFPSD